MPSLALHVSSTPLTLEELVQKLRELREHSLVDSSNFRVSAIFEFELKASGRYAYVGGVNCENSQTNRMSLHAEQNAMAAARAFLGEGVTFSNLWVMGGPSSAKIGEPEADAFIDLCGHCRQIVCSFANDDSKRYMVSVNGAFSKGNTLDELLPNAFTSKDLAGPRDSESVSSASQFSSVFSPSNNIIQPFTTDSLSRFTNIHHVFTTIAPRAKIVDKAFETSGLRACLLKIDEEYIPGLLLQDPAFLTTDALDAAIGHAVTRFGKDFKIQEAHLYGSEESYLSGSNLELLHRFVDHNIELHFYTNQRLKLSMTLGDYKKNQDRVYLTKLENPKMSPSPSRVKA